MLPSPQQLRHSTRLLPYFSRSHSWEKNSINCNYWEYVLPWLPFCCSLFKGSHASDVVMAIRPSAGVMGYSRAVSKIGYEPHFRLRSFNLGGRWIHAFAAVTVSRSLRLRVFNKELGLGPAQRGVQWPGFLKFDGRDAPRR